jgi:hypothetical protein
MPLTKATFKELVSVDDLPIGYYRNATPFSLGTSQSSVSIVPLAGVTDTTTFSPFYVPTDGIYTVKYSITSYTSGDIQEAIFAYKSDMIGVGSTLYNALWSPASASIRSITSISMRKGIYWISLRTSNGVAIGASSNSRTTGAAAISGTPDITFSINTFPINGSGASTLGGFSNNHLSYQYQLYDNNQNPATIILYNGTLSDYTPYQVTSRYYLYPTVSSQQLKIGLTRTG